jgi:argininosuccinate lyase
MKDACQKLHDGAMSLADELDALGEREAETPLPGYTHLQPAMPSSVPLWAGGFSAEIRDDARGLLAARRRADKNPLGSAAGYGVPVLPLDREHTRKKLGFAEIHSPVTAVQLSRGKAEAQIAFEIHLLITDLGRLSSDLILFCTQEFSYVALPASMTTGSSIMPQKRNPDVFELIRGRSATSLACLNEIIAIGSKLTSGYHRDLQLIKAPLFRAIDLATDVLQVLEAAIGQIHFIPENIRMEQTLYATEEAYRLVVEQGVPFREAYRRIGRKLRDKE